MPFDNTIKTCYLKGSYIRSLILSSGIVTSSNVTDDDTMRYYINGELLDDNKLYKVAAVDYIFDQASYPFGYGEEALATGILFRDILIEALEKIGPNGKWTVE